MQTTINFALANAFAKLNLSSDFADRTIAHLWRPCTPPKTTPALNIDKLNRQQAQRLASISQNDPRDERQLHKDFLTYVNDLSPADFAAVALVEHMESFFHRKDVPEDDDELLAEVSYHLRTYDVGVKTHRVYELRGGVHVFVGMLGMNEFRGMVMPDLE
jgi:hypothetical protein